MIASFALELLSRHGLGVSSAMIVAIIALSIIEPSPPMPRICCKLVTEVSFKIQSLALFLSFFGSFLGPCLVELVFRPARSD